MDWQHEWKMNMIENGNDGERKEINTIEFAFLLEHSAVLQITVSIDRLMISSIIESFRF